jgi:hypothetical protein
MNVPGCRCWDSQVIAEARAILAWFIRWAEAAPTNRGGRHRSPATGLDEQKEPAVAAEFKLTPAQRTRGRGSCRHLFALLLGTALS